MANQFCLPNHISPETFLQDYWQKKPLLIKNGLPEIIGQFEPQDIIELAQEESVTARLVKQFSEDKWQLKLSPLDESDFSEMPQKWSVLIQNMEQWSPELGNLWNKFGFISQWQRDDIMVSYAPAGGSVGKHYDEYDVFLVQGYGHRRWQVGKWCDPSTEFKANQPIRIFDDMGDLVIDEVMEPGDILYIPSRMAHYGVAQNDCLTFSFGLRYPNPTEILENICKAIEHPTENLPTTEFSIPLRLNPELQPTGKLNAYMVTMMKQQLITLLNHSSEFDKILQHALATTVSARRYDLLPTEGEFYPDELLELLQSGNTISQDNNCKIIYLENPLQLYINGEYLDEVNPLEAKLLQAFANGESLDYAFFQKITENEDEMVQELLLDSLCDWLENGWILINE